MSDPTLKPCPFCNGAAEIDYHQSYRNISTGALASAVAIYCTECLAHVTFCREDAGEMTTDDLAFILTEQWNKRACPPTPSTPSAA